MCRKVWVDVEGEKTEYDQNTLYKSLWNLVITLFKNCFEISKMYKIRHISMFPNFFSLPHPKIPLNTSLQLYVLSLLLLNSELRTIGGDH